MGFGDCYVLLAFYQKKSLLLLIDEKDVIVKFVDRVDNFKQLSKEERRKLFEGL